VASGNEKSFVAQARTPCIPDEFMLEQLRSSGSLFRVLDETSVVEILKHFVIGPGAIKLFTAVIYGF
jgi:hypothetical protein